MICRVCGDWFRRADTDLCYKCRKEKERMVDMERLTSDTPQENFETMMNFVFSRDGWAHIRHDGEREDVPLTEWAKEQCLNRDCTYMKGLTIAKEIDDTLCDCLMDGDGCPVALSYCFACQASHLRDRLKAIEDILGDEYDLEHLRELTKAEKEGRLFIIPFCQWIPVEGGLHKCSKCHTVRKADPARDHYCPNCGFSMHGAAEEALKEEAET